MTDAFLSQLIALRHWLHAHPEVSREEVETARHVQTFLATHAPPDEIVPLAGAGFAAIYEGRAPGKSVLLRAELDALPIHEVNRDLPYRSCTDGVGHKCGHDGHMAILAGVGMRVSRARPAQGRVVLLFQPDEETGTGARGCCAHDNFAKIAPDYAFALHNLPGFPAGQIVCRDGVFASAVKYIAVHLDGKEAHSAQPETGVSPSMAMAEITLLAAEIQRQFDTPDAYALAVPVYSQMGVPASGVCPGKGEIHLTFRSASGDVLEEMWGEFSTRASEIARNGGLQVRFEPREAFAETRNDPKAVSMIVGAAVTCGLGYASAPVPFRWGEDFGEITRGCTGAMFGLGAGEDRPALHNPDYDFPDGILAPGIAIFEALIQSALE